MSKYLHGVTHAVVNIPNESDARQSSVSATVDIHFGQDTAICGLKYVKQSGRMTWHAPMIQLLRDGKEWVGVPVFTGDILVDLCKLASQAISRVKKQFGKPAWGHKYIVLKDKVIQEGN